MVLLNDQLPRNLMLAEDAEHPDLWRVEWFDGIRRPVSQRTCTRLPRRHQGRATNKSRRAFR